MTQWGLAAGSGACLFFKPESNSFQSPAGSARRSCLFNALPEGLQRAAVTRGDHGGQPCNALCTAWVIRTTSTRPLLGMPAGHADASASPSRMRATVMRSDTVT